MTSQVDVQLACDDDDIPPPHEIERWVKRALHASGRDAAVEIAVRVVGLAESQRLNCDYRHKDSPTNVLSFPAGAMEGLPPDEVRPLGDIVVCAPVVQREAAEQGKAHADHWAHMLVHGTLHLLGYDHQAQAEAVEMEALEARVLAEYGIADPYGASRQRTDRIQPL